MKKVLSTFIFLSMLASTAWGMDIQLQWNPVASSAVAGYKVYYSGTSPDTPLQGSGAQEGASPLDVGNVTSVTLSGLPLSAYYIAVTAYTADRQESAYSNIVCNYWMPTKTYPTEGATNVPRDVQFAWSEPANPDQYQFTVYYGPQGGELNQQMALPGIKGTKTPGIGIVVLVFATLLLLSAAKSSRVRWAAVGLMGAALLASCSGGDSSVYSNAVSGDSGAAAALLDANTTYDWKVVANNGTVSVESTTGSFTTGSN